MTWIPLHVHSQYSVLDALASVKGLAQRAKELEIPALALTDHGNLYGAVDFYTACVDVGVKPIIGCEVYVAPTSRLEKKRMPGQRTAFHLVLLAKDQVGYRNLCKLVSNGFTEGFYYHPRIDKELLKEHSEGLICLSACLAGSVPQAILNGGDVLEEIGWYHDLFGEDYYLELQRHVMEQENIEADGLLEEGWLYQQYESFLDKQERVNQELIKLAKEQGIKLVATNDIHYLERSDWKAHEILLNVQSGEPCEIWEKDSLGNPKHRVPNPKRRTYASHELYFKSPGQMEELFADVPEAMLNTLEVADKCRLELDFKTRHYPVFVPPDGGTSEEFLRRKCEERIPLRYTSDHLAKVKERYPDRDPMEVVKERLETELSVVLPKGMGDYLLIVWDFIDWAKRQGIPVGPGRGSGAGSIILYLIGVTDIEPLRFNLFFERFINPERLSYPDIDVDICMERRGEVIEYTVQKYGKDNVAQIITFGTMKAKMAIKDVGRVLSVPLSKVNSIAKLVPEDPNMTLDKALELDPDLYNLYNKDEETHRLIDLAKILEGSIRNTGIHAAGVIVSEEPLTNHIPICTAKDSTMAVTQYAMKPVEKVGMLKIDFLGLKTLTSIQKAAEALKSRYNVDFDPLTLPLNDKKAFDLLNKGKTLGVFQMESGGMQDLSRSLHLDRFEEIIAVVALYRPGPMDMIPSFVARKHGREPIEYDDAQMKAILEETYGIMVYQEQVMQIAQEMAGYSLGEGDVLRKAMGKKIMSEMTKQREKFRQGAIANGLDERTAVAIFDKMEKFAEYGFNKSHAASYGFLTYITAYLKANYPGEWMAALMTCDRDDTTKVARFIRECQAMGINILPPDVNEAGDTFKATDKGVRFAMTGIKGVGHGVVEAIIEERNNKGFFESLYDFCRRIDTKRIGKKAIESLVFAGCFDFTGWSREQLALSVEPIFEVASKEQKDAASGALSLFSLIEGGEKKQFEKPPKVENPARPIDLLFKEKELLGFFLTGHPMNAYRKVLQRLSSVPFSKIEEMEQGAVFRTAFIVETAATRIASKSGRKFAILNISDGYQSFELPIWPDMYDEKSHLLVENQLLYAVLQTDRREGFVRLNCRWLDDLTAVNQEMIEACDRAFDKAKSMPQRRERKKKEEVPKVQKAVTITLNMETIRLSHIVHIKKILRAGAGDTPYTLVFSEGGKRVGSIAVDTSWGINPTRPLQSKLSSLPVVLDITS